MIDLHSHTNQSDGSYSPAELVEEARRIGLEALAITDHDTFAGYDEAAPIAARNGLDLVCGVEVNSRSTANRDAHILGYFLDGAPSREFRAWLAGLIESRRQRNRALIEKLRSMGVAIELSEVEAVGRTLTGRPHFARVLVDKGYAGSHEEAFRKYLGETAPGYVRRDSPETAEVIRHIAAGGGLPVLAHPVRLGMRDAAREEQFIAELQAAGLRGIEVYHSDHRPADVERYRALAEKLGLAISGGSDFHGAAKPHIPLGNAKVPRSVLDDLRRAVAAR